MCHQQQLASASATICFLLKHYTQKYSLHAFYFQCCFPRQPSSGGKQKWHPCESKKKKIQVEIKLQWVWVIYDQAAETSRDLKQGRQWRSKGDDATVVCPAANFKKKMKSFKYVPEQWFFFYIFFCIENKRDLCSPNGNCFFSILNLHFCVKRLWIVTFFLSLRISKERCPKSTNNACYFALR